MAAFTCCTQLPHRLVLQGTRRLFVLIQGESDGRAAAARVARALSQQGPARMADVLGSLVARTLRDRLALLSTLSVTARQQVGGAGWGGVGLAVQVCRLLEWAVYGSTSRGRLFSR